MIETLVPYAKELRLFLYNKVQNDIDFNFQQEKIQTPSGKEFEVKNIQLSGRTLTRILYDHSKDHQVTIIEPYQ